MPMQLPNDRWRAGGPMIANGRVILTAYDSDKLECLDLRSGKVLWWTPRDTTNDLYVGGIVNDRVIVVSRNQVRGYHLTGEDAEGKPKIAFENSGIPSPTGHGVGGKGVFYVPVRQDNAGRDTVPSGEIWAISVENGEVKSKTAARKRSDTAELAKYGIGNLVFQDGMVVAQSAWEIACYPQLEQKRAEMDRLLAANKNDPIGLLTRGELLLDEGKLKEAIADFKSAEDLSREALTIYEKAHGERHADVARARSDLAVALGARGDGKAAEALERQVLEMARSLKDLPDRSLEVYVRRLANTLEDLGKLEEGGRLYQESLDLCRKAYGAVHPQVAFALDNLAIHYMAAGDHARAEPLFRESLAMLQKIYGDEHPEVAQTMGNLADFLAYDKAKAGSADKSDLEEAEALHRKALEMNRRIRPDHPYVGDNYRALAELRRRAGNPGEGETLVREALRIYRLKLPEGHAKIVAGKLTLAEILVALRRPKEAEPLLLECHEVLVGQTESAIELAEVRKKLAAVYAALGQPERAASYGVSAGRSNDKP
jgi:tetratricopeptide (TPR) repeat protein